jgi:hypothetical protein
MSYAEIDPIIFAWIEKHHFTLFTEYKDSAVRSIEVVSASGQKFQIWLDRPASGKVSIHLWDFRKKRCDWEVAIADLATCLELVAATVFEWIRKS